MNNIDKIEAKINIKTTNEQTAERVTVKSVRIDDEVFALDVVKRGEKSSGPRVGDVSHR